MERSPVVICRVITRIRICNSGTNRLRLSRCGFRTVVPRSIFAKGIVMKFENRPRINEGMKTSTTRMRQTSFYSCRRFATIAAAVVLAASAMDAAGVQAELRSAAAILPNPLIGGVPPTAPAGGAMANLQPWICDAAKGFAPVIPVAQGVVDPFLAIGAANAVKLPMSSTITPATCGQIAWGSNGLVYVTQAVVDTNVTPSSERGILRTAINPLNGAFVGPSEYIATTAGLDGNQPTAAAIGPDGNLYVGFLKNGNIKRVLNPGVGTAQVVQSVGNTPSGHPARAFAFVGTDLYIASSDALSVIHSATNASCNGGCNAVPISDGFSGVPHVGVTSDGVNVFFAVAGSSQIPGSSQVWRLTPATGLYSFVAQGGADRNGANASNFSFVSAKTNLLAMDSSGNLWIGDDTSGATTQGAGRLWTISGASLASLPAGNTTGGTNVQAIFGILRGPWLFSLLPSGMFSPTFNADGTFTATISNNSGVPIGTDAGTWVLTPPNKVQPLGNAQAHLTFTDNAGIILLSADVLQFTVDSIGSFSGSTGSLNAPFEWVANKVAP